MTEIQEVETYHLYNVFCAEGLTAALVEGLIPKADLIDGRWYGGHCRNAKKAIWRADRNRFEYERTKFNHQFTEDIEHPEDDKGYDIFVPKFLLNLGEENDY